MTTQSVLTTIPENKSLLQTTKYSFVIPDLPFLRYFAIDIQMPGVATTAPVVSSPFSNMYRHGDKLEYGKLSIKTLVDEDIRVWEETYKWLVALTKPSDYAEYVTNQGGRISAYHDAILTINTNSNIPNVRITFFHCHPESLSGLSFTSTGSADNSITCDISFRFDRFTVERLN